MKTASTSQLMIFTLNLLLLGQEKYRKGKEIWEKRFSCCLFQT